MRPTPPLPPTPRSFAANARAAPRLLAALLLAATFAVTARAQTVRSDFYVTNGGVNAEVLSGTTLYVGGSFTSVATVTGSAVPVDSASAIGLPSFPQVDGMVGVVISDGAGGWYLGGKFTQVGGQPRANLAHVRADWTVDAWNPGTDGQVYALQLAGNTLYVGGAFASAGGQARARIAALDVTSDDATAWNPGADDLVRAFALSGNTLWVGGRFLTISGVGRNRIAALDTATAVATAWAPGASLEVSALAIANGTVYAGGSFTVVGGRTRNRAAAIDSATASVLTTWNPNLDSQVNALAISGNTVYLGGGFGNAGGQPRSRLAAVDLATGTVLPWAPEANGAVMTLAIDGAGLVYAGGDFTAIGTTVRSHVAAIDPVTGTPTSWDADAFGTVQDLATGNGIVYVAGVISGVGGVARDNLAAFNTITGQPTAWAPGTDGAVLAMVLSGRTLYVGGTFATIGGDARNNLAALDATTGGVGPWNPDADGAVSALACANGVIYAGGTFGAVGGTPRSSLAAIDSTTGLVTAWDPGPDGQIFDVLPLPGVIYVGGQYSSIGGQLRNSIAAVDPVTGLATAWDPNSNGTIRGMAWSCGSLYAAGFFTTIGGTSRNRIAALDPVSGLASAWNPNANGPLYTLTMYGGVLYTAGIITQIGGQLRSRIAALDPVTGLATPWNPSAAGIVRQMVFGRGMVYAGGQFTSMGGLLQSNLAALTADASITCPAIPIAPASVRDAVVGVPYSQTFTASGGASPYCWSVSEGTLPAGLALSSATGVLAGTPSAAGALPFSVLVTDAHGCTNDLVVDMAVFASPITATVTPQTNGLAINPAHPCVSVPFQYARTDTTAVRGLSVTFQLDASRLALCTPGTPAASVHAGPWLDGFASSSLQVTDAGGGAYTVDLVGLGSPCGITTGGRLFTIDVSATGSDGLAPIVVTTTHARDCANSPVPVGPGAPESLLVQNAPVVIAPATLPDGVEATHYHLALAAAPGTAPFAFTLATGTLPAGLTLTSGGVLDGTPTTPDTTHFTVSVSDTYGAVGSRAYTLVIGCPVLAFAPDSLPADTAGAAYHTAIVASGGGAPYAYTLAAGALPAGVTLGIDGVLDGIATATGHFAFTLRATDAAGCTGTHDYSLAVECRAYAIATTTLPAATAGVAYAETLTTSGGTAPFAWSVAGGHLPDGLALDHASGALAGTPTIAGRDTFTIAVSDAYGCAASRTLALRVDGPTPTGTIAAVTDTLCLSTTHTVVSVPFVLTRTDTTAARSVHVEVQLDAAHLALATPATPAASVHAGSWFAGFGPVTIGVTDLGAGAYAIDIAIASGACGPTGDGVPFTLDFSAAGAGTSGTLAVTAAAANACGGGSLGLAPGALATLRIATTPPAALADLAAAQVLAGNGSGDTTGIAVTWTAPTVGTVALYRAPWASYPDYAAAAAPDSALAPAAPWALVAATAVSGLVDHPPVRGFWYYAAFVTDACGNTSAVSNRSAGALDYLLGDVSNGQARGTGDNLVELEDVSLLGANYGITADSIAARGVGYLDVGPTTDGLATSRPLADHVLDFEDLMVFAANFERSAQLPPARVLASRAAQAATGPEHVVLEAPSLVGPGEVVTATLRFSGAGRVQGLSARLRWDPNVVEPVAVTTGRFVERQGGLLLSPGPGAVDAALLGLRSSGLAGDGVLATVTFRARQVGDPGIALARLLVRDAANRALAPAALDASRALAVPDQTLLLAPAPNPFRDAAALAFALAHPGPVELAVFDVNGRRVRTLVRETRAAGVYHLSWDGRDEGHGAVAPGVYFVRLVADGRHATSRLVQLR